MKNKPNIWITLLMALFFVSILSFVMPKNSEKYLGDMFWTRKTFAPEKYNVVLMGDSRVYRGLNPDIIDQILPKLKTLNFAFSNGGLNTTMFNAASNKLTLKDEPRIIVLGIAPNTITGYTKDNSQFLQEKTRAREEIIERMYLNPVLYWFSATTPEKLKESLKPKTTTSYYLNDYRMNGYVESVKFPIDTTEAILSYTKDFNRYKVDSLSLKILFEQVAEWNKNGISVLAFRPPVTHTMLILENTLGLYNENAIKQGITKAGGHWIDLDYRNFCTYDGSHLDNESSQRLSERVAWEIKKTIKSQTP